MRELELTCPPNVGLDPDVLEKTLRDSGKLTSHEYFRIERRSIDARKKKVVVRLRLSIQDRPARYDSTEYRPPDPLPDDCQIVGIVGAGPAGLFAALEAIELGFKPVIFERGKNVRDRRRDIAAINKQHIVNPESNYCFGEGGAGTYSDGKLYTRSKKRGSVRKVFEILVAHGAPESIFYEAHPHIGTNKLPKIVSALRETIKQLGGELHFNSRVTKLRMSGNQINGIDLENGNRFDTRLVILATGHSARDIFELCHRDNIVIEAKPFALGVRIEHPQEIIDRIQYHCSSRGDFLPASSYSLVHQTQIDKKQRGVFSFCMCPGGFIVPAATSQEEIVINGMSPSRRDSRFANSGIVTSVEIEDIPEYHDLGPMAFLKFQSDVERAAWEAGGKTQCAPAQRLIDFLDSRPSSSLPESSYQPGLSPVEMKDVLPDFVVKRLKNAFRIFGKKMKGYLTNEAQLVGVESRTSSPVRIPRVPDTGEHIQVNGLFPCGEGAGFAGGIVSAAMDGQKVSRMMAKLYPAK